MGNQFGVNILHIVNKRAWIYTNGKIKIVNMFFLYSGELGKKSLSLPKTETMSLPDGRPVFNLSGSVREVKVMIQCYFGNIVLKLSDAANK